MTNSECLEPPAYPLHDGGGVFNDPAARLLDYLDRMSGSNPDQGGTNGHTPAAPTPTIGLATITAVALPAACTPAPAWTDAAPERFIDPPGMVTVLVPLDTVIVPGEVDVTVSPLPLNIAEVVTLLDSVTVVYAGDDLWGWLCCRQPVMEEEQDVYCRQDFWDSLPTRPSEQ